MTDYISREAVLSALEKLDWQDCYLPVHIKEWCIDEIPSADVAPVRHGRWKKITKNIYQCSVCGKCSVVRKNYCADCGAKMDLGEEE